MLILWRAATNKSMYGKHCNPTGKCISLSRSEQYLCFQIALKKHPKKPRIKLWCSMSNLWRCSTHWSMYGKHWAKMAGDPAALSSIDEGMARSQLSDDGNKTRETALSPDNKNMTSLSIKLFLHAAENENNRQMEIHSVLKCILRCCAVDSAQTLTLHPHRHTIHNHNHLKNLLGSSFVLLNSYNGFFMRFNSCMLHRLQFGWWYAWCVDYSLSGSQPVA